MATTAALLSSLAQTKRRMTEQLEAKGVSAAGTSSLRELADKVLDIPSSAPAVAVPPEAIAIPQGPYAAALTQLAQAREALRQNLGAKGVNVLQVPALSALAELIGSIQNGSGELTPVPVVHVDWSAADGLDAYAGTQYYSYLYFLDEWMEFPSTGGTEPDSKCIIWVPNASRVCAREGEFLLLFPGEYQMTVQIQLPAEIPGLRHAVTATLYDENGAPAAVQRVQDPPLTVGDRMTLTINGLRIDAEGSYRLYLESPPTEEAAPDFNQMLYIYAIALYRMDERGALYADTAALEEAIQTAGQYTNPAGYIDFTAFSAAKKAALALLAARPMARHQSRVDLAAQALAHAIAALQPAADTAALQAAIREAKQYPPEDAVDFSAVAAARDAGQSLLDERPAAERQAEVDAAAQAILDAIAGLEWKPGTRRNPIAFKYASSVTAGLFYSYNGSIYRCKESASPCLVLPGTSSARWEKAA